MIWSETFVSDTASLYFMPPKNCVKFIIEIVIVEVETSRRCSVIVLYGASSHGRRADKMYPTLEEFQVLTGHVTVHIRIPSRICDVSKNIMDWKRNHLVLRKIKNKVIKYLWYTDISEV